MNQSEVRTFFGIPGITRFTPVKDLIKYIKIADTNWEIIAFSK